MLRLFFRAFFISTLLMLCSAGPARAQMTELTSADRLALLYSSQLVFGVDGTPSVRVGLANGLEQVSFSSTAPLKILPLGAQGPELTLPAGTRYTVAISRGVAGEYQHHVVLERVDSGEPEAIREAQARWADAGLSVDTLEVGSIFAISGQIFDTRQTLIVTGTTNRKPEAESLKSRLESTHQGDLSIHSEMTSYPSGMLTLSAEGMPITLRHQDVLWVDPGNAPLSLEGLPGGAHETGRRFRGAIIFAPDRGGALAVINAAPIEEVLRGVVPAEIYSTAPVEALKVQSVAARGTMLAQVGVRHLADPYHLCNGQHCQVFKGLDAATPTTDIAISATRGDVLFGGKRLAETFYSSNCGGTSERAEDAWGIMPRAYLHAHDDDRAHHRHPTPRDEATLRDRLEDAPDAWCNIESFSSGRHFRWSRSLSASEVTDLVNEKHPEVGRVRAIKILERGVGGRVSKLEVVGKRSSVVVERELTIRRLFGGLKSALFVLDVEGPEGRPKRFTFVGGGFGHGVGMCQTGAMGMAIGGHTFDAILGHYYPGTHIESLW